MSFCGMKMWRRMCLPYFDLYKKYQDDYGIAEILEGKVKPSVYARIDQAAFDERLSVVNLLLDGVSNVFYQIQRDVRSRMHGMIF